MTYEEFLKEWNADTVFILCHTSGSTGTPTTICLPKEEMMASALRTCEYFNINRKSLLYSCISPDYIGGKMVAVRSRASGAGLAFESPSNRPLENYEGSPIDLLSIVPSQMLYLLDHPEKTQLVRHFLIGGAPLSPHIKERIINAGLSVYESYGMTETASHIALKKVERENEYFHTLGTIQVFYHDGNKLGIEIDGKKVLTNDVAEISDSHHFKIMGRADNIINTGGKKVSPEDVEQRLSSLLGIPFYISSLPDEKWGERVVLVTTDSQIPENTILSKCREVLPPYEVPKEIVRIPEFPLTPNGKIRRKDLLR